MKWIPALFFAVLTFCQMTWQHFECPGMYYTGLAICLAGLSWCLFADSEKGSVKRAVYSFIFGLCLWNLIEELFFDPEKYDPSEYWGLLVGALFLTYQLWKKRNSKTK